MYHIIKEGIITGLAVSMYFDKLEENSHMFHTKFVTLYSGNFLLVTVYLKYMITKLLA